ncbi:hypothetical protein NTE_01878 [Candidatus Nitrososphaera evergladensis SR1]|uniref:Uncharacterized protein n=1 Tax=Candidatus Nitrososphaera evergladensis SR1 TaxID=1459636 RepID=A0A075MT15_9ARCH|nr:hypothetical protein [Candidatus Nitrososphaera evergladensis]AIF83937.1 hypothetical protein NTE_01878 [Candidatus Nitrososphaera evergladensis SR1]
MRNLQLDNAEKASINEYLDKSIRDLKVAKPQHPEAQKVDEEFLGSTSRAAEMWFIENDVIHDIRHGYVLIFRCRHGRFPMDMEFQAIMREIGKREPEIRSLVRSLGAHS